MSPSNAFPLTLFMFIASAVFAASRIFKARKAGSSAVFPSLSAPAVPADAEALLRAAFAAVEDKGVQMAIKAILEEYASRHATDFKAKMQAMTSPKEQAPPA